MNLIALVSFGAVAVFFLTLAAVRPEHGFYVIKGRYGSWISAMSIVAAFTGGGAILNTTSLANQYGLWALADVFPSVFGLALAAFLVRINFFGTRFSTSFFSVNLDSYGRAGVSTHFFEVGFLYVLVVAAQFRGVVLLSQAADIPPTLGVLASALLVALYSYRGFAAVTRTDFAQLLLMVPMYLVVIFLAGEPHVEQAPQPAAMPPSLVVALALPLFFLPISQEVHQRGASTKDDKSVGRSYAIASVIYLVLGSTLVLCFSQTPGLAIQSLLSDVNPIVVSAVAIGIFSALLSSMDTAVNISAHALQQLPRLSKPRGSFVQAGVLVTALVVFQFFPTVLSLILFAIFIYMAGPALTFISIYLGVHPDLSTRLSIGFCSAHALVQFKLVKYLAGIAPEWAVALVEDSTLLSVGLVVGQLLIVAGLALRRRYA